jgi:hypothetical protein
MAQARDIDGLYDRNLHLLTFLDGYLGVICADTRFVNGK